MNVTITEATLAVARSRLDLANHLAGHALTYPPQASLTKEANAVGAALAQRSDGICNMPDHPALFPDTSHYPSSHNTSLAPVCNFLCHVLERL